MAIQTWIDKIADLWSDIDTHDGGKLRAYRLFVVGDIPESITAPAVLTFPVSVSTTYSTGGPLVEHWIGRSEFHLFDNIDRRNYPMLMPYFAKIRNAAIGSITLGGTVVNFNIGQDYTGEPGIEGPVEFSYGDESPNLGLVVNWFVKENIAGQSGVTPAA